MEQTFAENKMKILLAVFYNFESFGLRILHSILSKNHDCKMLFINENNIESIISVLKEFKPNVLGFSLVSTNFPLYKILYDKIRNVDNFKIILGGWHPTLEPEKCKMYCDIVCRGEMESMIEKIIDDIEKNNYNNCYTGNMCQNFDYPLPIFDDTRCYYLHDNKIEYVDPYIYNYRYGTIIGRGCPYNCTYCSNSYMKKIYPKWSKIRYRSCEKVLQELRLAVNVFKNIEQIIFYDEIFLPKGKEFDDFLINYKKEINKPFYCLFYPGTCSEKRIIKLKEAGMEGVWLGIQSGSERIRKNIFKRNTTNEKIMKQVELFHKHGIKSRYDFIFENPFETKEDFQQTINMIKSFPKPYSINFFQLKFFPNTEITNMALKNKLIEKTDDEILICGEPDYKIDIKKQEEILKLIEG